MLPRRPRTPRWGAFLLLAYALLAPRDASAGDVTLFATFPSPSETWDRGYGAALSSTWFRVVTFEAEAARMPGETPDRSLTSFSVSALLSPPIGPFTPYGGLGIGVFRQTLGGEDSDIGRVSVFVLGMKVRIAGLIVIRGDYRRLNLSGTPLLAMDSRISVGAGISF
jgi:hypothetical protein